MARAQVATLAIKIITDAKDAQAGLAKASQSSSKFRSTLGVASKVAAGALAGVAAAAISAGNAAADDAQGQAVLAKTLTNTAHASKAAITSNEDWIASMANATGVADDQLRPALGSLVRATGDVAKSQAALKTAMDVSAATGKPLQSVADALAKGYGGNTAALGKLVPGLDKATVKSGDMTKIMAELARTTGGSAAAAADTAAGKMKIASNSFQEAKESIGTALLPAMATLATLLATVGNAAQQHHTAFLVLGAAIGGIALAVLAVNTALQIYEATLIVVQAVQAATWLSNPIFLVIAAVLLLVGGIVLLWKNSETFRRITLAAWGAIRSAAVAAWNAIKGAAAATWAAMKSAANTAKSVLLAPFNAVKGVLDDIIGLVHDVVNAIKGIHFPHIPSIPNPFSASAAAVPGVSGRGAGAFAAAPVTGSSGLTINVFGVLDGQDAARKIRQVLRDDSRRRAGVRLVGV